MMDGWRFFIFAGNVVSSELSNMKIKNRIVIRLTLKYCSEKNEGREKLFHNTEKCSLKWNGIEFFYVFTST